MRAAVLALSLVLPFLPAQAENDRDRLHEAARKGDVQTVKDLLAKGADVNARNRFGATALWFAAYKNRTDVIKLLLAHKADPDIADGVWASSPLSLAASFDQLDSV